MRRFLFICGLLAFICLILSCKKDNAVTPNPPPTVSTVTVTSNRSTIFVGQTEQMTATVTMSDGTTKAASGTWGSDNTSVATVNQSGLATGVAPGDATIYFDATNATRILYATNTEEGGGSTVVRGSKKLTVQAVTVTGVSITSPNSTIIVGQTEQMTATVTWSDGTTKAGVGTWGSDNPSVAAVNQSGLVTGISAADATIFFDTASSTPGLGVSGIMPRPDVRGGAPVSKIRSKRFTFRPHESSGGSGSGSYDVAANMRGTKKMTVRNIWSRSGQGDMVFDMPTYVKRVRITATYTGYSSNFIVHIGGNYVVNELLGTGWGQTSFSGTYVTSGGTVEILHSSGVSWSFTEVLATNSQTYSPRRVPNFIGPAGFGNREYEIYKRELEGRRR